MRRVALVLLASLIPTGLFAAEPRPILFIAAGNNDSTSIQISRAIQAKWKEREPGILLANHFFNPYAFPPKAREYELMGAVLAERHKARPPKLILTRGDAALHLAVPLRNKFFPDTAIIAFEITNAMHMEYADSSSLYQMETTSFGNKNLELAHRLFPKRKKAIVLATVGAYEEMFRAFSEGLQRDFPHLEIDALMNPTLASADPLLRLSGPGSFILNFCPGWVDEKGDFLGGKDFIRMLDEKYGLPVFEFLRADLGEGLVGGVGIGAERWGNAAAEIGLSVVLDGANPEALISTEHLAGAFVDHAALLRFGSSPSLIPKGAEVINAPLRVWIRYQLAFQAAIAIMILSIAAFSVHLVVRRRQRLSLIEANERLEREVAARTRELVVANEELSASNENLATALRRTEEMQATVLRSAREITLGRVAAGLANELNSPLNAARSANASSRDIVSEAGAGIFATILSFDERQKSLFLRNASPVLEHSLQAQSSSGASHGDLERRLSSLSATGMPALAADLFDAGLAEIDEGELADFAEEWARPVAACLFRLSALARSMWMIDSAVDAAASAVAAVREYVTDSRIDGLEGPVDLRTTIERALLLFKNRFPSSVTLRTKYESLPPARGVETSLVRVWVHLVENALYAMESGGLLSIALKSDRGLACVTVEDEGRGVDPAIADRLFEPFVTTKPLAEGMGLGLAYCRRVVESFGGSIEYRAKGKGAEFQVRLPLDGTA